MKYLAEFALLYRRKKPRNKKNQNKSITPTGKTVIASRQPTLNQDSWFQVYGGGHFGQNSFSAKNGRLQTWQILRFTQSE